MSIVILGSLGNISKPLVQHLIAAGKKVTVVSSSSERKSEIEKLGATAAIGLVTDQDFLENTFKGAEAVYTIVPPYHAKEDWKGYIAGVGQKYANAIKNAGVKYVVNLSSIGAHLADGVGPVSGLYHVEQALNKLEGVNILHLRPAYFYYNLLNNIGLIKNAGIIGGNFGTDSTLVLVHPKDIAKVAAEALISLNFADKSVKYIASDEKKPAEIASILGKAIGKPELPWVDFKDEESFAGMIGAGLYEELAKNYVEMGTSIRNGKMIEDYLNNKPSTLSETKLEHFAEEFALAYNA